VLDGDMNSIALVVKHMAGNMRFPWTDLLITDCEKPDRNRDSEFVEPPTSRAEMMALWEEGWSRVFFRARTTKRQRPRKDDHNSQCGPDRRPGRPAHAGARPFGGCVG
jgi:hypothetical protein